MKSVKFNCTECGFQLIYCPELKHVDTERPILKCTTIDCSVYADGHVVLGNMNNFGEEFQEHHD